MRRLLARATALIILVALVPGGAWALARWGRLDLLGRIRWTRLFSHPDDGSLVLVALTVLGWLAWLLLLASLVSETIRVITRGAVRIDLPGARLFAPLAAVLVASIAGLVTLAHPAPGHSGPGGPVADPPAAAPGNRPAESGGAPAAAAPAREALLHTVADGDDLWTLAERYYGNGADWRRIVEANRGTVLTPLDRLQPGTTLEIPDPAGADDRARPAVGRTAAQQFSHRVDDPDAAPGAGTYAVEVDEGDSMWAIAREELGDGAEWPRIADLNRAAVPDPSLIHPGQVLAVPDDRGGSARPTQGGRGGQPDEDPARRSGQAPPPARDDGVPDGTSAEGTRPGDGATPVAPAGATGHQDGAAGVDRPDGVPEPDDPARPLADEQAVSDQLLRTVGPIGATTAAVVLMTLAARRRWQLNARPVGRRCPQIGERGRRAEAALAAVASRSGPAPTPATDQEDPAGPTSHAAAGPGGGSVPVLLGSADGTPVHVDLMARGVLTVDAAHADLADGLRAGLAIQLADESAPAVQVRAGPGCAWLSCLDSPRIVTAQDRTRLRRDAARLVAERTAALSGGENDTVPGPVGDPGTGEAWEPVVLLLDEPCPFGADELTRIGVCAVAPPLPGERAALELGEHRAGLDGLEFAPELVMAPARRGIEDLLETADSTDYTKAWWWTTDTDLPDDIVPLRNRGTAPAPSQESTVPPATSPTAHTARTPFLRLLGPVELSGAQGRRPARAVRQCLEYCAWILAHPAGTAVQMTRELLVADTTRRSNMSRLRAWLGSDEDGEPYLPDAYSGHISLHPQVTSDWEQLQLLVTPGVNRVSDTALEQGLALVRGAPLADAAPGEWAWAEQMRLDMISTIRDIGVELAGRRLGRGEYEQAGHAARTALAAAPGDEQLMGMLLRAEHLAGNRPEAERLVLQITRTARQTSTDLTDETVALLQEVMEGRRRARLA